MKIEIILLGILATLFFSDFILKGIKRKKIGSVDLIQDNEDPHSKTSIISFKSILTLIIGGVLTGYGVVLFSDNFYYNKSYSNSEILKAIKFGDDAYIWNFTFGFIGFLVFWLILNASRKINQNYLPQLVKFGLKRKKNISLFIVSSFILKILIHFFIYPVPVGKYKGGEPEFSVHVDAVLDIELWLFIPSTGILLFIVWILGDKIKAR